MGNPFVHVELHSSDLSKSKEFYKSLFDWKLEDMNMENNMTYTMIQVGDGVGGGMMKNPVPGGSDNWLPYTEVDDIKTSTEKAKSLGGQVAVNVTEIPNMGSFSIIVDPTGATLGLWQSKG